MTTKYVLILGDQKTHFKVIGPFDTQAGVDVYLHDHGTINAPPNLSWQCWPMEAP